MADYPPQPDFYQGGYNQSGYDQNQGYGQGYDMGGVPMDGQEFPQDPQFQQFDYSQNDMGGNDQYMTPQDMGSAAPYSGSPYTGSIMTPDPLPAYSEPGVEDYENEPPLMEELGINFDHIKQKTLAVLNPVVTPDTTIMQDTDLAGPLVFCFIFGGSLLMAGKVHFGYIYGIGVIGCLAMYALLNLMSITGVSVSVIVSVLGYCLLPMCLLSSMGILLSLQGLVGIVLTGVSVCWCSLSASKLFVSALSMDQQQLLVAYPCALVYGVFALIAVF